MILYDYIWNESGRVSLWNSGKYENYLLYVLKERGINRYG